MTKQQEKELKQHFRKLTFVYMTNSLLNDNWEYLSRYFTKKYNLSKRLSIYNYADIITKLEGKDYYFFTWENETLKCFGFKTQEYQKYLGKKDLAKKDKILIYG